MEAHIDGYKERTLFLSEAASVSTHQFGPGFGIRPCPPGPPLIRPSVYQHVHNQRLRIWDIILSMHLYAFIIQIRNLHINSYKCIYIYTDAMYMYKSYIIYKLYYKCVKWLIPSLMAYLYYSYIVHHTLIVWSMAYTIIYHPKSL
jgi:hypothetical protein